MLGERILELRTTYNWTQLQLAHIKFIIDDFKNLN